MISSLLGGQDFTPASSLYASLSEKRIHLLNSRENIDSAINAMLSTFNDMARRHKLSLDAAIFNKSVSSILELIAREAEAKTGVIGNVHTIAPGILYTIEAEEYRDFTLFKLMWHSFGEGEVVSEALIEKKGRSYSITGSYSTIGSFSSHLESVSELKRRSADPLETLARKAIHSFVEPRPPFAVMTIPAFTFYEIVNPGNGKRETLVKIPISGVDLKELTGMPALDYIFSGKAYLAEDYRVLTGFLKKWNGDLMEKLK